MRIKKTSQYINGGANLSNVYGTSNENGYTQDYINGLETYSTTEKRVGTWIDGKPLYRKVVSMTVPTTSTNGTAVDGDTTIGSNIDVSFVEFGYIILNQNKWTLPASLDEYYTTTFTNAGNTLKIRNALTVFSGKTAYISVLYTKTTDTTQNNTRSIPSNDEVEEPIEDER